MTCGLASHPLLVESPRPALAEIPEALLEELRDLAAAHDHCTGRARQLYEQLRKMLGQDRLLTCLLGIQELAQTDDPAGARLLAACIDANTPGALLLPRVRRFRSLGRLLAADTELVGEVFLREWQQRLAAAVTTAGARLDALGVDVDPGNGRPVDRPPLPLLRAAVATLAPQRPDAEPERADLALIGELVRLEADACQERVSRLAGVIDPFRVTAVMRALPLLNRADAEIRDLGRLASWLESGDVEAAFRRRVVTGFEVLEENERARLLTTLRQETRLAPLAAVYDALVVAPLAVRQVAGPVARLLVLGRALQREGVRTTPLTLVQAVHLVLAGSPSGRFELPLDAELQEVVGRVLLSSRHGGSDDLAGLEIQAGRLVVAGPRLGLGDRIWRHDLPTLAELTSPLPEADSRTEAEADPESETTDQRDKGNAAVKQMVMNNIGSVSIVLGFLRNPKVTAIPGLVADVVRRTRSGRVLEVIAGDRRLTGGHANKDVPRALLESPVNIPVKTLRRFIHVKYVSKTDLRRMARDKARLRKEVCKEIEAYLESLA